MLLTLLKTVVKATLHNAVEEWALETGLPRQAVEGMRARRLALAAQEEARADALAAASLGVEDEAVPPPPALLTVSAAQLADPQDCPPTDTEEASLLAAITRMVKESAQTITEHALRNHALHCQEGKPAPTPQ